MALPPRSALIFILVALLTQPIIHAAGSRKLDEIPGSEKCTPCNPSPPPPSPPPPVACPPPPPPALPPPSPPPPKNPPSNYCPPPPSPPSSSIIYITGPPGNLYPIDNDFSGSRPITASPALLIGCGLLAVAGVWFGF